MLDGNLVSEVTDSYSIAGLKGEVLCEMDLECVETC